jgi:hypothetical protein
VMFTSYFIFVSDHNNDENYDMQERKGFLLPRVFLLNGMGVQQS